MEKKQKSHLRLLSLKMAILCRTVLVALSNRLNVEILASFHSCKLPNFVSHRCHHKALKNIVNGIGIAVKKDIFLHRFYDKTSPAFALI